jgi:polysaccharide deacetylase 2 family uncharacterized protein YibQ
LLELSRGAESPVLRKICIPVLLLAANTLAAQTYQIVLDGEDPVFSVATGAWTLDKTGSFLGSYKFSAPGPNIGMSLAVWTIDGIPAGTYDVEFYVDNGDYAADAQYRVESDTGTTTVTRSQNFVGAGWHPLGTFDFHHQGRITQTDAWTGAGTKVIADAIRLTLQGTPSIPTLNVVPPTISLVIDDLGALNPATPGNDTHTLFNTASPNMGYAIIPFLTYSTAVLQDAQAKGIQTLLHQPMQYIGQADTNPADPTRLYIGMTDAAILSAFQANLNATAPYTAGVNNHQGSRFSQYWQGLGIVVDELKARDQFYFDSRTISDSLAYDHARADGLLTVERDLFIDGNTIADTKANILSLATRALYAPNIAHTGIGHQRVNTTPGVLQALADLPAMGVGLRPIGHEAALVVESDFQPAGSTFSTTGSWTTSNDDLISQECADGIAYQLTGAAPGSATFTPDLQREGNYRVFIGFTRNLANSPSVKVTIQGMSGVSTFVLP